MMLHKYSRNIVNAYRSIAEWIYKGIGKPPRGGAPKWPRDLLEWIYYQSNFFPKECYYTLRKLKEIGQTFQEIARLFQYPSTICHWLYHPEAHFGVKDEYWAKGLSVKEGIEYIEYLVKLLTFLRKEDPFCRSYRNIILSRKEVDQILKTYEFIEIPELRELQVLLSKLNMVLWHYCILLQGGLRVYSQEYHGPYRINKEKMLFVREYSRLRPVEVWRFVSDFPYNKVVFYEIYRGINIQVDILGHYWTSAKPADKLVKIAAIIDGKEADIDDIINFSAKCNEVFRKGLAEIKDFEREDWVKKWIELGYLWLKPIKEMLNEDWRPPRDVIDLAYNDKEAKHAQELTKQHYSMVISAIISYPKDKAIEEIARMHLKTIYGEW